jgi:uncharacterized Zn finger protein
MGSYGYGGGWAPYVSVAERRRKAERMLASLKKKGRICQPVVIDGRTIARTFWGKNWCESLETYSDYSNRLPRGRTYVRNGSVVDLQIMEGKISALVSGSQVYEVNISVHSIDKKLWRSVLDECAGKVASLVELLQGRLSGAVMEVVTRRDNGLFPIPKQISFRCSCPDSASMCKHVAATLYGVGARFDSQPELLFRLRNVDPEELIRQAGSLLATPAAASGANKQLEGADLSALFGINLDNSPASPTPSKSSLHASREVSPKKIAASRPKRTKTVTAKELSARGIPPHIRQAWLNLGVVLRTEMRGVYEVTKKTEKYIEQYLAN